MKAKASTCVLVLLLLLAGVVRAEDPSDGPPQPPRRGPPPAPVLVAPVVQRTVAAGRTFSGTVEASKSTVVGSEFAGLVVAYLVKEGDYVSRKQPLARLRTEVLGFRLAAARADLELKTQRLAELENGSRPEEIAQAEARVQELLADLELRQWKLEAAERLYGEKTISEDEVREARLAVRAAELAIESSRAALALVVAGPRAEVVAQARADLARQAAEVKRLEDEEDRYEIQAPFEGYVTAQHAEVGQWLATGAPVAEIVALKTVDIRVPVVEDFVSRLVKGAEVPVRVAAVPGRILTGTIFRIVPQADLRGRTFPVLVRLANEVVEDDVLLKAGMFAEVTLSVGDEAPALFVPKDAVVLGGPAIMVWAVNPENQTAMPIPVELGVGLDDLIEVKGPLAPGMQVVVQGNERIFAPGTPLQILER